MQKVDPTPMQLVLMPTGAGQPRPLTSDNISHVLAVFPPDGKRFIFTGFEPNKPTRTWVQSVEGGAATPITPEGVAGLLVTPDGTRVLARDTEGERKLFPIDAAAGAPEAVRGIQAGDGMVRFTGEGRSLLVRRAAPDGAVQIFRVDLASGSRTSVRTIVPMPGTGSIGQLQLTPDASAYVYGYGVTHSDLFLVKGLK